MLTARAVAVVLFFAATAAAQQPPRVFDSAPALMAAAAKIPDGEELKGEMRGSLALLFRQAMRARGALTATARRIEKFEEGDDCARYEIEFSQAGLPKTEAGEGDDSFEMTMTMNYCADGSAPISQIDFAEFTRALRARQAAQ